MSKLAKKKIMYVKGLSPDRKSIVSQMDPYYRNIQMQLPGNNNLENFGSVQGARNIKMCLNGETCKMVIPDVLVNCMADPDSLESRLKHLEVLIPKLKERNPNLKVINSPTGILKTCRNDISDLFQGLKDIKVPKVVKVFPKSRRDFVEKIKESGIKLPVIVRAAAVHGGINLTRIDDFSEEQVEKLDKFALDGGPHYVTEFVNFQSKDGYYRKVRIIMVNGEPHLRHMLVSDHWNIHGKSREMFMSKHPELEEEEKLFLSKGTSNFSKDAVASLQKIYKTLDLEVFGMDVGILPGGKLLVFEINAAMEFMATHVKQPPHILEQLAKVRNNFLKLASGN